MVLRINGVILDDSFGKYNDYFRVGENIISILFSVKRHRVANRGALQDGGAVCKENASIQLRNRFVLSHVSDRNLASDGVTRTNRGLKGPVHLQEDGAGTGKVLCDDSIEYGTRNTALHNDAAKARFSGRLFIIMQGIPVTTDFSEQFDVTGRYEP
jgi:hypothetical protein